MMMMKVAGLFLAFTGATSAAPALVWTDEPVSSTAHHSADVSFEKVMSETFGTEKLNVVFLLGRKERGEETLSSWTSSGSLPGVASKSEVANDVHYHVSNVQNAQSVATMANRASPKASGALKVSLDEFSNKLEALSAPQQEALEVSPNGMVSKAVHALNKRTRALKAARTLVVDVPANVGPKALDNAVVHAIDSESVGSVILSSVRSVEEVKHERDMRVHYRRVLMEKEGERILQARRRRLNDNADDEENANGFGDDDVAGKYYVHMTPNIFAGLLFFLLFIVVTMIGISCMNMIQGQDVYVSKMPSVGREA